MIEQLDIINLSHYDLGFTDHPLVCHLLQSRWLDQAIDLAADPAQDFSWTVESNNAVLEWWQTAPPARRDLLVELVGRGRIEVCAMPMNHTPTLDAREWRQCTRWLPEALWQALRPRVIMQCDVNGFPRAGAMAFLDAGVDALWMGLNLDTGGSPVPQPSAFWWRMPDGRRLFVWNAIGYPDGYFLFEPEEWRRGPLPLAADTRYRPPRRGDMLAPTAENLQRAHAVCTAKLDTWQRQGYALSRAAVSMTNMWRVDNDPPCAQLPAFIAAWNAAGLQPRLAMTTPSAALAAIRREAGEAIPVLDGEWTNWWANGVASTPRALSASRQAKRLLDALDSPLYQALPEVAQAQEQSTRLLCFFDEHTWGSWNSAAMPDSLDTRGQLAEKVAYAYRPLALTELAVGDVNRQIAPRHPGIHVVNPYPHPYTGWVTLTDDCLRGEYAGVTDEETGREIAFDRQPGVSAFFTTPTMPEQFTTLDTARVFPDRIDGKVVRFWVDQLPPASIRSFTLHTAVSSQPGMPSPVLTLDESGWPVDAAWGKQRLFTAGIGDFAVLEFHGFAPRWTYKDILAIPEAAARQAARHQHSTLTEAIPTGKALVMDTGPTLTYIQDLAHPRLAGMRRVLEVQKGCPHARLSVSILRNAKPSSAEIFYCKLPVAVPGSTVSLSCGGTAFHPDRDLLPHACRDYFAIDDQVVFAGDADDVVVDCHDTALASLGGIYDGLGLEQLPPAPQAVYAVLYNNIWYTNFAGDETGRMDFNFTLYRTTAAQRGYAPQVFAVVNV